MEQAVITKYPYVRIPKRHVQKCHDYVILSHLHFDVSLVTRGIAILRKYERRHGEEVS